MSDGMELDIWFDDLKPEAQERMLIFFGVRSQEEMNWDSFPIMVFNQEDFDE